jgi:uncharacterized protein (DUF433 family)
METVTTDYAHIVMGEDGVPRIEGTTTKVIEVVMDQKAFGWTAEEIHLQHDYLSLSQIYSALAYYWDHKDELDADMERRHREVEEIRKSSPPTPFDLRLRSLTMRDTKC